LKNDVVIDFLTSPPTDFSALKMFFFSTESHFTYQLDVERISK